VKPTGLQRETVMALTSPPSHRYALWNERVWDLCKTVLVRDVDGDSDSGRYRGSAACVRRRVTDGGRSACHSALATVREALQPLDCARNVPGHRFDIHGKSPPGAAGRQQEGLSRTTAVSRRIRNRGNLNSRVGQGLTGTEPHQINQFVPTGGFGQQSRAK